ncbi:MAG TPA: SDR family NAD(P)-dependent oxidoreductase [Methylomirabilota bacterium]|nr:SDR family NAD(P)-dependent oxidoreductase [Methylomirabilota bacterium]
MRLLNKVAVITGGAQGIGRAIALGMAREGAKVIAADLQGEKAKSVAAEIHSFGGEASAVEVDVSSEMSVQRLADHTFERFGRIDILVNDAGVYLKSPVMSKTEAEWDKTLNVNLGGNFLCARAFVPAMRRQKSGRIISIASSIAHSGAAGFADYAASKAAIIGFVKALARELGPDGITVNAICPGSANTDMPRRHRTEDEVMARLRGTPLRHVLEPEDIAGPVLFLASDAAAYITGQAYNINCGTVMI